MKWLSRLVTPHRAARIAHALFLWAVSACLIFVFTLLSGEPSIRAAVEYGAGVVIVYLAIQIGETTMKDPREEYIKNRDDAFENDDLAFVRKALPEGVSDEVITMTFHKSRFECTAVSEGKRYESRNWLADRGLSRAIGGGPLTRDDPLPRETD